MINDSPRHTSISIGSLHQGTMSFLVTSERVTVMQNFLNKKAFFICKKSACTAERQDINIESYSHVSNSNPKKVYQMEQLEGFV